MSTKHQKHELNIQADHSQTPESWGQEEILTESKKKNMTLTTKY